MELIPINPVFPTANVVDSFSYQAKLQPKKPAIIYPELIDGKWIFKTISFASLEEYVCQLCNGLSELGIGKGDKVLIMVPMSLHHYQLLLAIFKLGAIAVYIDPGMGLKAIEAAASVAEPKAYVGILKAQILRFFSKSCARIPIQIGKDCPQYLVQHDLAELAINRKKTFTSAMVTTDDTALITFTSGTTGLPKGANRTHGFLLAQNKALLGEANMFMTDVYMPAFPIVLLLNLSWGITSVIPNMNSAKPASVDPSLVIQQIKKCGANLASGSPAYARPIAEYCKKHGIYLPELRNFWTGGAPVSLKIIETLQGVMPSGNAVIIYGSTECEPISHIDAKDAFNPVLLKRARRGKGNCVGVPASCVELKIIGIDDGPIYPGKKRLATLEKKAFQPGEIVVTGEHVNKRYYKNPEAEKETKIKEIVKGAEKIWHRTGDVGYLDGQGRIWLLGRISSRVQTKKGVFFTIEVENVMNSHPLVENSALLAGNINRRGLAKAYMVIVLKRKFLWRWLWRRKVWKKMLLKFIRSKGYPIEDIFYRLSLPMDKRHNAKIEYPVLKGQLTRYLR
ncbi:AMP-binding protein [Candidatus Riflebacteria bacterium]